MLTTKDQSLNERAMEYAIVATELTDAAGKADGASNLTTAVGCLVAAVTMLIKENQQQAAEIKRLSDALNSE